MKLCFFTASLVGHGFVMAWVSYVIDFLFLLLVKVGRYLRILLALLKFSECIAFGMMDYCLCECKG